MNSLAKSRSTLPNPRSLDAELYPQIYHYQNRARSSSLSADSDSKESEPPQSFPQSPPRTTTVLDFVNLLERLDVKFVHTEGFILGLGNIHLSSGGYANVIYHELKIEGPTGAAVAVKAFRAVQTDEDELKRMEQMLSMTVKEAYIEVSIMKHPRLETHPSILELLAVSISDLVSPNFHLSLVTEFANLGSLDKYLAQELCIDWCRKLQIFSDVTEGLTALHMCDVIHNDVKCSNILLFCEGGPTQHITAKISDFGCSVPLIHPETQK